MSPDTGKSFSRLNTEQRKGQQCIIVSSSGCDQPNAAHTVAKISTIKLKTIKNIALRFSIFSASSDVFIQIGWYFYVLSKKTTRGVFLMKHDVYCFYCCGFIVQ